MSVTEGNKTEYVDLMVQWRLGRGIHEQTKSFRKVFTIGNFCASLHQLFRMHVALDTVHLCAIARRKRRH